MSSAHRKKKKLRDRRKEGISQIVFLPSRIFRTRKEGRNKKEGGSNEGRKCCALILLTISDILKTEGRKKTKTKLKKKKRENQRSTERRKEVKDQETKIIEYIDERAKKKRMNEKLMEKRENKL